jgi:quercetin dioxygenase-like cupin family protein
MRFSYVVLAAILTMSPGIALAQQMNAAGAAAAPTIVTMDDVKWTPGTGMLKGTDVAVLSGDPSKPGPYVLRLRIPANTKVPPHFHGDTENVTVISGALWVGLGDSFDESKMKELGPGSFVSVPANLHHYAMTKTATIIQIHGVGPSSMTAIGNM